MQLLKELKIEGIKKPELFTEALTHASYVNEHGGEDYERLEFLGDRVWDLVVSTYLYKFDLTEGQMTKKKIALVNQDANYEFSMKLNLNEYIRLGKGQKQNENIKIVSDVFESFIAALYLNVGFNNTYDILLRLILDDVMIDDIGGNDYKSKLQEMLQAEMGETVSYRVVSEQRKGNDKWFVVEAVLNDHVMGSGSGYSKQEAERNSAKDAIEKRAK